MSGFTVFVHVSDGCLLQVWFTHASSVITQLISVRPDPRLVMSHKVASRVAKNVRTLLNADVDAVSS